MFWSLEAQHRGQTITARELRLALTVNVVPADQTTGAPRDINADEREVRP
jgi:hypothetical protein